MTTVDAQYLIAGPPRNGKTTFADGLAAKALAEGWWVFAHDPNHQYKRCVRYENVAAWRASALAAATARTPMPRGASIGGPASELVALVVELGRRHNTDVEAKMPMLVIFDEGSMLDATGATWLGRADGELVATRRHLGIAPVFLIQRASGLHPSLTELATDVVLFRHPSSKLARLEETLSLEPGELAALATAPPFRFVHVKPGRGIQR